MADLTLSPFNILIKKEKRQKKKKQISCPHTFQSLEEPLEVTLGNEISLPRYHLQVNI